LFLSVQLSQQYVATGLTSAFIFCNQGPNVWERIHLLQLLILNEYAARYAVARHYLGIVNVN